MSKNELIEKAVLKLNGEFPQGDEGDDWLYQFSSGRYVSGGADGICPRPICTREEFNATADRMRGKPDWSLAPDWAQWLAQSNDGKWHWHPHYVDEPTQGSGCFLNKSRDCCFVAAKGKLIGDWRNTLEKRPEQKALPSIADRYGVEIPWDGRNALPTDVDCNCEVEVTLALGGAKYTETGNANRFNWMLVKSYKVIDERYKPKPEQPKPAPAKPWFEAGELPKAGECCEYKFQNPDVSWQLVQVNYISKKHAILTILEDGKECHTDGFKVADFRPIRTDKEKVIEAAVKVCTGVNIATTTDGLTMKTLNKLYDAGLLRLPDQK